MDYRVSRKALTATGTNPPFAILQATLERAMSQLDRSKLTPGQRAALAIQGFEMEVNSDGLDAYLRYRQGDTAEEALAGLKTIGAFKFADVLSRVIALFPGGRPATSTNERAEQLDRILQANPDVLEPLDHAFFAAYDGEESLAKALIAYIRSEPSQFFFD